MAPFQKDKRIAQIQHGRAGEFPERSYFTVFWKAWLTNLNPLILWTMYTSFFFLFFSLPVLYLKKPINKVSLQINLILWRSKPIRAQWWSGFPIKLQKLDKALASLSERQREAVYYYFYKGMTYEEVRELLDFKDVKSARNLIYKVVETLRKNFPIFF